MSKKRLERLCDKCGSIFKYLPSTTKKHVNRKVCYKCKPKNKKRELKAIPLTGPFGCLSIYETSRRIAARKQEQKARGLACRTVT